MVNQNKIFSFKIKRQAKQNKKDVFLNVVERTVLDLLAFQSHQSCQNRISRSNITKFLVNFKYILHSMGFSFFVILKSCNWLWNLYLARMHSLIRPFITKTCLYDINPLKPHFYIVKLGFTGVYIIFLISAQKHRLWVLVRTGSNEYPQSMFWAEIWKISEIFIWKFSVFGSEIFYIFE